MRFTFWEIIVGLALLAIGVVAPHSHAASPSIPGEREESFDYFQDGQQGRATHQLLNLDLGNGVILTMVRVKAGQFQMGSAAGAKDRLPDEVQHNVQITHDFYLAEFEITRGQFQAFIKDTGYRSEPESDGQGGWGFDQASGKIEGRKPKYTWQFTGFDSNAQHPVVNVTWNDATAFCGWLAKKTGRPVRLPSEAEWEYAARAGSTSCYYSGDDSKLLVKVANVADAAARKQFPDWDSTIEAKDGFVFTAPVGSFLPNRFGLCDMLGNAWEWCQDCYGPYEGLSPTDAVRNDYVKDIVARVMRGGGFGKRTPRNCSVSRRVAGAPSSRDIDLGFRICLPAR